MSKEIQLDIQEEISLLQKELKSVDELYDEVYGHYSKVKKGSSSGTLTFIEKQTANLISLKTSKVGIIQNIISAKKSDTDMELKIKKANEENGNTEGVNGAILSGIYDLINENRKDTSFEDLINKKPIEQDIDVDSILSERADEILAEEERIKAERQLDDSDEEPEVAIEEEVEETEDDVEIVFDINRTPYAIDSNSNIVEDYPMPTINIVEERTEGEDLFFIDDNGTIYDVVEFE